MAATDHALHGQEVTAMTYESIEYDRPPVPVRGVLEVVHVDTLNYDQYLVGGIPVNPDTVRPVG